jgi:hypothetical protein
MTSIELVVCSSEQSLNGNRFVDDSKKNNTNDWIIKTDKDKYVLLISLEILRYDCLS